MFRIASFVYFERQGGNFKLDPVAEPVESIEDQRDMIVFSLIELQHEATS